MTTEEGNKLIAEFDGWVFEIEDEKYVTAIYNGQKRWHDDLDALTAFLTSEHGFAFHCDWNKLIGALKRAKQKIKSSDFNTTEEKEANKRLGAALNEVYNLNIENANFCFVKFIEWYNQSKNTQS